MVIRDQLDDATWAWLEEIGLRVVEVVDRSWPNSDTRVSLLTDSDGCRFYLKQFAVAAKSKQESNAYRNWLVELNGVPKLLSLDGSETRLLLSDLGERCRQWSDLSDEQQLSIQFQAGQFLKNLHEVPLADEDSLPIGDAIVLRARVLQTRIVESRFSVVRLHASHAARVVAALEELVPLISGFGRVPCHRDFWKRNWIWNTTDSENGSGISLSVLDFEHARPDLFVFDFVKNWADCWLDRPQWEEAFWGGYGRSLESDERYVLDHCATFHALQTIVWASEHDQMEFYAQGEALLAIALRGTAA